VKRHVFLTSSGWNSCRKNLILFLMRNLIDQRDSDSCSSEMGRWQSSETISKSLYMNEKSVRKFSR